MRLTSERVTEFANRKRGEQGPMSGRGLVLRANCSARTVRVIERLRSPPLNHGIARELRKRKPQAILEREIAELEQACRIKVVLTVPPNPGLHL